MIQLPERFHLPVPEHWTPEQALAVHEALEVLGNALWRVYGTQIQQRLFEEQGVDTSQLDLFDPDDPLPF